MTAINVWEYYLAMAKMSDKQFIQQAKILSDATRLAIVRLLARKGSLCACKILDDLHITQGTLSHHMTVLTDAKIVSCRKDGKWRHYRLLPLSLCEMASFVQEICLFPSEDSEKNCTCSNGDKNK